MVFLKSMTSKLGFRSNLNYLDVKKISICISFSYLFYLYIKLVWFNLNRTLSNAANLFKSAIFMTPSC